MSMMETWKDIKGYEGRYQVSDLGRVKSLCRSYSTGAYSAMINMSERIMRQKTRKSGYRVVGLWLDGVQKDHYVHRLVAEAFLDNKDNLPYINHKDRNPGNNVVGNLEYCTPQYNAVYCGAHLVGGNKRKKPIIQLSIDGAIVKVWDSAKTAGLELKCNPRNINNALKNPRRKTAYGYVWKYQ